MSGYETYVGTDIRNFFNDKTHEPGGVDADRQKNDVNVHGACVPLSYHGVDLREPKAENCL